MIGDDRGVSKSSSDNGLVNGLADTTFEAAFAEAALAKAALAEDAGFVLEATTLVAVTFTDATSLKAGIEAALICEAAEDALLSKDANELVSERVGLPPTLGL